MSVDADKQRLLEEFSEFKDRLPSQEEVVQKVAAGQIFYGPFCGYETS